jgi:hypothetical protein
MKDIKNTNKQIGNPILIPNKAPPNKLNIKVPGIHHVCKLNYIEDNIIQKKIAYLKVKQSKIMCFQIFI